MTMPHRYKAGNGRGNPGYSRNTAGFGIAGGDAEFGRLEQRVFGIEQGFTNLVQQMERDRAHVDSQFDNLQTALNDKSRTPWGVLISGLSLVVTLMSAIGVLAYVPIKSQQDDLKETQRSALQQLVPRNEHEREWTRNEKTLDKMLDLITRNQTLIVPRGEHEEKWRGQAAKDMDMQRQIDEGRKMFGETYSLRDALKTMQERLDKMEDHVKKP